MGKDKKVEIQKKTDKEVEIPIDVNAVLDSLPKEKREILQSAFFAMEQRSFSGPLPAPEDFAEYEKCLPGSTDRILKMAEKQVDHRIDAEKLIIKSKFKQSSIGQILGAILVALFGVVALVLGLNGHDDLAKSIGVTTVVGVAAVFVLNKLPFFNKEKEEDVYL